jgi:hypothetical protein
MLSLLSEVVVEVPLEAAVVTTGLLAESVFSSSVLVGIGLVEPLQNIR